MTSRLDRLFILLESGSAVVTRRAAAKQIGEVQKLHPHELHNLLRRLMTFLHSSSWDTRIAAAQAIEAILNNVPHWDPQSVEHYEGRMYVEQRQRITLNNFNLDRVLEIGEYLMSSVGTEYDLPEDVTEQTCLENIQRQQDMLNEKLGLSKNCPMMDIGMSDLVSKDDLMVDLDKTDTTDIIKRTRIEHILENFETCLKKPNGLSCRERNRARRMARQASSSSSSSSSTVGATKGSRSTDTITSQETKIHAALTIKKKAPVHRIKSEPSEKKPKLSVAPNSSADDILPLNESVPDATGNWVDAQAWPLEAFSAKLHLDLFSPRWEVRHGAATAIRELLKSHANGAGKCINMTSSEMSESHQQWMEECTIKLLCVLALDRFGDFVSDQVVAPVRETCAQALGIVLKSLPDDKVHLTVRILMNLITQKEWEVRHGGLLGLKYLLVVRNDLIATLLPIVHGCIINGLFDDVDDVGAVAASTLIPIAPMIPDFLTPYQVSKTLRLVWELLSHLDELDSACNSFMGLLAAFLSLPNVSTWIDMQPIQELVSRLWPFLCHSSSSVRRSTLKTMLTLTKNIICANDSNPAASTTTNGTNGTANVLKVIGVCKWPPQLLQETMRHIFQRALVEPLDDIQETIESVWKNLLVNAELSSLLYATCPYVASWMCLAMQPARMPFMQSTWLVAKCDSSRKTAGRLSSLSGGDRIAPLKVFLGGTETTPNDIREHNVLKSRCRAGRMIGMLSKYLVMNAPGVVYTETMESPTQCYTKVLLGYLESRSSIQRMVGGLVISHWGKFDPSVCPGPPLLQERLHCALNECTYYEEVAFLYTRLLQETREYIHALKCHSVTFPDYENEENVYTLQQIKTLCTVVTEDLTIHGLHRDVVAVMEEKRARLFASYEQTACEQNFMALRTQAVLAGAVVCLQSLPEKLNPIIKPLMESLKNDYIDIMQNLSAYYLVRLIEQIEKREICPNDKIVRNVCALLRVDLAFSPEINHVDTSLVNCKLEGDENPFNGIFTLKVQQQINGSSSNGSRGPGRPPVCYLVDDTENDNTTAKKKDRLRRLGATTFILEMCQQFQAELLEIVPTMGDLLFFINTTVDTDKIDNMHLEVIDVEAIKELMNSLQVIEVTTSFIHESLIPDLYTLFPKLCALLKHPYKCVRHLAARCIAVLSSRDVHKAMCIIIDKVLPMLHLIENVIYRQGAAEAMTCLVTKLQLQIVPYAVMLVVPLLGRMSDIDESVRLVSTNCFATLVQLMQLDSCDNVSPLALELQAKKEKDREFLEYLFSPKKIPDFKVPVPINAELRCYQQAGINWLWFLNKYKLHGILCDDMGLGKTLQTIGIICGDHFERSSHKQSLLPSLVICPPTLTGHWVYEVRKFLPDKYLDPLHYVGLPHEREKLRMKLPSHNLVVASYDIVRKDIEFFTSVNWNYCVLDEGHVIKNGKTKSSKAIKQLCANHRLILSGTPIQNNVLELWSLFDFLMPGFLGTERQFMYKYSRPIVASRDPKSSSKEQEAGALAMEALHRQVLPFLLRRVKEDVLTDLPPKITQDLLCDLSPLQERLYEDFSRTRLSSNIKDCLVNLDETSTVIGNKKTHVFQALRYLQNVCNHPKLVLNSSHPEFEAIQKELASQNQTLDNIDHSAKLPVLKQLLLDCGIGVDNEEISVNQHRALIFCQLKAMLDILENDFLKKHLPNVSYMRLDGTIPASERHGIVNKFNSDPSIDVLMLTTQVGGLGLNLTGADTVIFVEHDWNPMKDLQAMDRAHRIGQRKVVNVYRLITRKSLEEKIMGLQKFKLLTANTIVSDANSSVETMGTDQLLDLFDLTEGSKETGIGENLMASSGESNNRSVLANLPELWDDKQYEEEYDLTQFVQSLNVKIEK